ncbi:MAG: hypothetical protein ACFFDF_23350 [Candidatus Odinarchaeota archaeon]
MSANKNIKEEIKSLFLKKDGTPFKRVKTFWIKHLIQKVYEITNLDNKLIENEINQLIREGYLLKNYIDSIAYNFDFEESMDILNSVNDQFYANKEEEDLHRKQLGLPSYEETLRMLEERDNFVNYKNSFFISLDKFIKEEKEGQ